jgi:hypothetical protein
LANSDPVVDVPPKVTVPVFLIVIAPVPVVKTAPLAIVRYCRISVLLKNYFLAA